MVQEFAWKASNASINRIRFGSYHLFDGQIDHPGLFATGCLSMRPTLKREFYLFRHGRPCHQSPRGSPSNPAFGSDGSTAHNLLREIRMRNADGLMTIDDAQEATCPCAPSSRYRSLKAQPLSQPLSSRIPIPIAIINLVAKYTSSGTRLSTCSLFLAGPLWVTQGTKFRIRISVMHDGHTQSRGASAADLRAILSPVA